MTPPVARDPPAPREALGPPRPSTQAADVRWAGLPWQARLLDTLSSYLPMMLMGLMALGSWWLVKNAPRPEKPRVAVAPSHEPDYAMREFSVQRFTAAGPLRARIEGDVLRHFPDTDTLEVEQPRLWAYALDGGVTVARANRALSNADASEVQLLGDAQVTRTATATDPGLNFRGEFLHAFLKTEQVRSHLPVMVTRGGAVIRADSFSYDNLDRIVSLRGNVRATFAGAGAKSGLDAKPKATR